jgi:hypothetical protein
MMATESALSSRKSSSCPGCILQQISERARQQSHHQAPSYPSETAIQATRADGNIIMGSVAKSYLAEAVEEPVTEEPSPLESREPTLCDFCRVAMFAFGPLKFAGKQLGPSPPQPSCSLSFKSFWDPPPCTPLLCHCFTGAELKLVQGVFELHSNASGNCEGRWLTALRESSIV